MPERSRRVVVLAHCHLNVNTKVRGLACYPGARADVVLPLIADGVGIVQLPCPEASFLGMKRWGMTVEQYDTPAYRRHCRDILGPTVDTLVELAEDGCSIEGVLGVEGSPSCGVSTTCAGFTGGEIEAGAPAQTAARVSGQGVLVQELRSMLAEAGLADVPFSGVED
jgi:predicted secreted protein